MWGERVGIWCVRAILAKKVSVPILKILFYFKRRSLFRTGTVFRKANGK